MVSEIEMINLLGDFTKDQEILQVIEIVKKGHRGQIRDNGREYLEDHIYPVVASVISRYRDNPILHDLILIALLHDLLEDTNVTEANLIPIVSPKIIESVKMLTKSLAENSSRLSQNEKMEMNKVYLLRLAKGTSEAKIIKIEDRLQNLSCIDSDSFQIKPEKYKRYIVETRALFIPLAKSINNGIDYANLLEMECIRIEKLIV